MFKKILSLVLVLILSFSVFLTIPKPITTSAASITDEMADRFVNIFYRNNTLLAKEVKSILKGETQSTYETAKDIYSKIMSVYKCVDTEYFSTIVSEGASNALQDINFLTNCVTGFFTVIDNVDSFLESDNAMQKTVDGMQIAIGFLTVAQKGSYIAPGLNLVLSATELGLCVGAYLQKQYFKEQVFLDYHYALQIAYFTGQEIPYQEAPKIYFECGVTQEEADLTYAKLYSYYVLRRQIDLLGTENGTPDDTESVIPVDNVVFSTGSHTLFYNYTLTNPATVYPTNATNKSVTYYSGNTNIATVDQSGNIKPVSPGTVNIYAEASNGVTGSCSITILPFEATESNNTYTITGYKGNGGAVEIPSYVNGKPVVSIGSSAFYNCSSLTSIIIPDNVTWIGPSAFYNCSSLTSIIIPDSVTSIGYSAFYNCSSLTSVTIPDSVTSVGGSAFYNCSSLTSITIPDNVTWIGPSAFDKCSLLASVTIGNSVTSISEYAFCDCSLLTSVTIPDSVTSIGGSAFRGCSSLTSIIIPDSVTSISEYAFCDCSLLTSVTIPDSVTSIGGSAFRGCSSLTSIIIPDSVTSIGGSAFYNCSSLTSIIIPDSVTSIGYSAFYNCSSLTSITIPDSVTSIGNYVFYNCSSLTSVTIPDSVTSIATSAFSYCQSLTSISVDENNSAYCSLDGVLYFKNLSVLLFYPMGKTNESYSIPYSVTYINSSAFENSSLINLAILNDDTGIGAHAFDNCKSLTILCNLGYVSDQLSKKNYKFKCFGDMNNDKALNGTDSAKMRKALLNVFDSDYDEKIADMNQDNAFNLLDLVRLKKTIAQSVV